MSEEPKADTAAIEAAWAAFCDRVKAAGVDTLRRGAPTFEVDRAEGLRYLAQQLASSVEIVLDAADPAQPLVTLIQHKLKKWGLDSADAKYAVARVDPHGTYRLAGTLGTAHHMAIQLMRQHPEFEAFASLNAGDLRADAEGRFEVIVSAERPSDAAVWLPLAPGATDLLIREYYNDWDRESPGRYRIERLDQVEPARPLTTARATEMLASVADVFATRAPMWLGRSEMTRAFATNSLTPPMVVEGQGIIDNAYGGGWFRLAPDEALLIEVDPPEAHLWSFQLGNFWWESIDYLHHASSLNGHEAEIGPDGRCRIVIALEDPGVANWLDPAGHREGMILYRYQLARTAPEPEVRHVKAAELPALLPPETRRVAPDERRERLRRRRGHIARRWAP